MNDPRELFEQWQTWALKISRPCRHALARENRRIDPAELDQAALLGLYSACLAFDQAKGDDFERFAFKFVVGFVRDNVRFEFGTARSRCTVNSEQIEAEDLYKPTDTPAECFELLRFARNDQQRTVLYLRFIEGLNKSEVALAMDLSSVRISQLEAEALASLRLQLKTAS